MKGLCPECKTMHPVTEGCPSHKIKFEIGQSVWWARFDTSETSVECPDCAGKCHIRCIMGDGLEVTIDCENCKVGYEEFSRGRLRIYKRTSKAEKTTIIGMNVSATKIEYHVPESYIVPENLLFETEEAALVKAQERADRASREELDRITHKEKAKKSWAWNASYHRKKIRRAKKDIEYHTRKLDVAGEKLRAAKLAKAGT